MGVLRASLKRGPAHVNYKGISLFTRDDINLRHAPDLVAVRCSMHGQLNKSKKDLVIRFPLMLFGAWDNVQMLFPPAFMNPVVGTSLFGDEDEPMVIHAKNQDRITYHNAQITKLADLYLGVDEEVFAAAVEVTALIKNGANPEDPNAYFTRDTAAYVNPVFSMAQYQRQRYTATWGSGDPIVPVAGFENFIGQKGFRVAWQMDLQPDPIDGYGTVDMYLGEGGVTAGCRCIPIGPTQAQIDTAQALQAAHGALLAGKDLSISGNGGHEVKLFNSALTESGTAFGIQPLRVGELAWESTRTVAAGVASDIADIT